MRRLRKYSESLGDEYSWDVVSSCEQNSMQAIATNDDILIYDPKNGLYCRHSDVIKNGDMEAGIFDMLSDPSLKRQVMRPAKGDDFNKFASEWNALQKEDRPDILKTKKTTTFAFNTNESRRRTKSRQKDQGMDGLVVDWYKEAFPTDTDMFEDMEATGSTFADVWDALDNGEDVYDAIGADDSIVRERVFDRLAELTGNDYDVIYDMWMNAAYDYVDDFDDQVNGIEAQVSEAAGDSIEVELGDSDFDRLNEYLEDMAQSYWEEDNMGGGGKSEMMSNLYSDVLQWLNDRRFTKHNHYPVNLVVDGNEIPARDLAKEILDRVYNNNKEIGEQRMMNKKKLGIASESRDNLVLKPCPKCGGEAKFETVDDFPWVGGQIECADCGHHVYEILSGPDETRSRDEMMDILIDMWNNGDEKRMRTFDEDIDNPNDWSSSEGEVEIIWKTDFEEFGIEPGDTSTYLIDYDMAETHEQLIEEISRMIEEEYPDLDFISEDFEIANEDEFWEQRGGGNPGKWEDDDDLYLESSNGTIEVKLRATTSHYGKKIERGDERTITLDPSKAPTIYDEEDLMAWIADVATEQLPGGGSFSKWSFEIISPPDDVIIKAVKGEEGFGPDVEFDPETDEPEDIPDEVSYVDALKYLKKMRKAYDDHKINYEKYGDMRDMLVSSTVNGLLKTKSLDELADEWFKDYGTANGWGWRTSFNYSIAYELHGIHKKKHPEQHESLPQREHWRGWHEDNCSCGFCSSSDSSD